MSGHHQRRAPGARGFTLIEVTIAVAIVALVVAVAVPMVSSLSRAELRLSAGKVSALVRTTYDQAALWGGTTRLVFDLDQGSIRPEAQERVSYLGQGAAEGEGEAKPGAAGDKPAADEAASGQGDDSGAGRAEILATLGSLGRALGFTAGQVAGGGLASFDGAGDGLTLPAGVRLQGLWAEHLDEELRAGIGYLYFFPLGYTERAMIYLSDEGGKVYTLEVSPLTGRVEIHNERREPPSR